LAAEIRVNGTTFKRFKQVDLSRSIDDFAGECRIIVSQAPNNQSYLKLGDLVEIFFDGVQKFTGYLEKVTDSESREDHDISFRGRDKVADLIDSTVPDNVKSLEGVATFAELVQLCIDGLGLTSEIKVIDKVNAQFLDSAKPKAAQTGQTVGDFLNENARIVQVFLNTDGRGNVLIQRPSGKLKTILQNIPNARNNNIKESSFTGDNSQRFHKYIVRSNSSLASEDADVNDINNSGEAIDSEIRATRVFEKIAEKPMTSDECAKAAAEEGNIRRARSFSYSCSVAGFSAHGELWIPGREVTVKDPLKGVNGLFQTNTVTWGWSDGGEVTTIDVTLPDKGEVKASPTSITGRTTLTAGTYTVVQGDTLNRIASEYGVTTLQLIAANPQIDNPDLILPDQKINIPVSGDESGAITIAANPRNIPRGSS